MRRNRQVAGLMELPEEARQMGTPPCWMTYIATPDVEATARQAVTLGGAVHKAAQDIPTVGRFAILGDPQGAFFVAFTPAGPAQGNSTDEDFSWHELATSDIDAAFDFYERLFGWERAETYHGPMGRYQTISHMGKTFAGISQRPVSVPGGPGWLPYIAVPDAQGSARIITAVGGRVSQGPMPVPGGSIVHAVDPQGAAFAVYAQPGAMVEIDAMAEIDEAAAQAVAPKKSTPTSARKVTKRVAKKVAKKPVKQSAAKVLKKQAPKKAAKKSAKKAAGKDAKKSVAKRGAKPARQTAAKARSKSASLPTRKKKAAKKVARRAVANKPARKSARKK
jgi:predicted enzyme related to lactoylglutathione lyase